MLITSRSGYWRNDDRTLTPFDLALYVSKSIALR
jgi:hypothetical protein